MPFVWKPLRNTRRRKGITPASTHELGQRFEMEIDELIQIICRDPRRYRQYDPPMRRHFSKTFPYAVIYLEEAERILIFAVMHMSRRPGYWKERLR
ncbi:MAG: type II toxin-antitoxin system RelE/ParE family toxin [Verrucomicrobia bacterium]|nr:type II toxin-antitoxin system RelE/ParE family toxin [Verrucomicrobiota bacterium]